MRPHRVYPGGSRVSALLASRFLVHAKVVQRPDSTGTSLVGFACLRTDDGRLWPLAAEIRHEGGPHHTNDIEVAWASAGMAR